MPPKKSRHRLMPSLLWEGRYRLPTDSELDELYEYVAGRKGYIYAISAQGHPEWGFKLGRTKNDPFKRARQFASAGVLLKYDVIFAYPVLNSPWAERKLHIKLKEYHREKEWYTVSKDILEDALQAIMESESSLVSRHLDENLLKGDDRALFVKTGCYLESFL